MHKILVMLEALMAALPAVAANAADSAPYPNRPIRLLNPFAPGGTVDINARVLAAEVAKQIGGNIVIDNLVGRLNTVPFTNDSDCLSVLDRRFWILDTRLDSLTTDGTGYGTDGTIWGGEFFLVREENFERVAHLRPFRLPGGEAAIKEGWRSAASLLWETCGPDAVADVPGRAVLLRMLERGINALWTKGGVMYPLPLR